MPRRRKGPRVAGERDVLNYLPFCRPCATYVSFKKRRLGNNEFLACSRCNEFLIWLAGNKSEKTKQNTLTEDTT